jgi:beta-glucanase (GH16 family)
MRYNIIFTAAALATSAFAATPEPVPGMTLVWSDDFSGSGPFDKSKWQYYNGAISNGEQEAYPASGDYCKLSGRGSLLITPENSNGKWASCRIETINSWTPPVGGKVQFQSRFKLGTKGANLQGIWPAFWALGDSMRHGTPWPACGEIDTFENVSGGPLGYGTLHCGSTCKGSEGLGQGMAFDYGSFHTWSHVIDRTESDWHQQSITWFMDGQSYHVIKGSDLNNQDDWTAVAQKAMYITLNVAVGGSWPGPVSPQTASGKDAGMEIQYVGVYQSGGA